MASTYTVNIGIEKPGTGDQSGTWGNTTNTNFDIIDQATNGIATVTLAAAGTSGSPNTLLINNGALSDGRNRFIEFNDGADLGATAYVQLDPNDAEKIVHIRNSLSGSRSLILFQGTYSASNDFEIPNGADVLVKFDGGGTGATVTDVNVNLTPTKVTTGDLDVDNININGNTISSTDTNGNLTIDPNGTGNIVLDANVGIGGSPSQRLLVANTSSTAVNIQLQNNTASDLYIGADTTNLVFYNGGSERMRIDSSGDVGIGTSSPDFKVEIVGGTNDGLHIKDAESATVFGGLFTQASNMALVARSNHALTFGTNDTERMRIDSSGNVVIGTGGPSSKLSVVSGTNAGITVNDGTVNTILFNTSSANGSLGTTTNHPMAFYSNNAERMRIDSSGNVCIGNTAANLVSNTSTQGGGGYVVSDKHFEFATDSNRSAVEIGKNNANDGQLVLFRKQGTAVGSIGVRSGNLQMGTDDVGLEFHDTDNTIYPANVTTQALPDGTISFGSASSRFNNLYLSGGVYLGGTGSANKLDDYEEGVWTPVLSGATTTTYTSQIGRYTKVGELVYLFFDIHINSVGDGAATTVVGLPFAPYNNDALAVSYWTGLAVSAYFVGFQIGGGPQALAVGTTAAGSVIQNGMAIFQNGSRIIASGCYRTPS